MIETRIQERIDPVRNDGRDIDPSLGTLLGEGSQQKVWESDPHLNRDTPKPYNLVPGVVAEDPTYYGRPILKQPVWEPVIPAYFFVGGAAGAALTLGSAAQLSGDRDLDGFLRHCHWIGIAGSSLGAIFLIYDLGRPMRFLNMMRVFRPTSPMNMGTWILSAAAPLAITAGLFERTGRFPLLGELAGYAAGPFGAALAAYTGVLVGNSAIPLWSEGRVILPLLFVASAITSAASLLDLYFEGERGSRITFLFGTAGRIAELGASKALESRLSRVSTVALPLEEGRSGRMWKAATALTAASLIVSLLPGGARTRRRAAGILGIAGSLLMRFAIYEAGKASAADPRSTFHLQRAGMAQNAR